MRDPSVSYSFLCSALTLLSGGFPIHGLPPRSGLTFKGQKKGSSKIDSHWPRFGYIPIPEPITVSLMTRLGSPGAPGASLSQPTSNHRD